VLDEGVLDEGVLDEGVLDEGVLADFVGAARRPVRGHHGGLPH
jgi:hypothetical protein